MASDPAQLAAQIRFALERLSELNAQHDWEHLCRHLTRARLCSNVLPATGHVQLGGDQGRDFETFRTYLSRSPLAKQSFVGLIADKPIAFACTLEKRAEAKARSDVKTIMAGGTPVESIYFFCTRGIAIARRHQLQKWAQATYKVYLEILDGEWTAQELSAHDTFWIAVRYLELPADLLPPLPATEAQDWYTRVLNKWQQVTESAQTFADFTEIKIAARTALGPFSYSDDGRPIHRYERPELPFWIDRLDEIAGQSALDALRRHALYEASVLRLRGLGTLIGQEERLRQYFAEIPQLEDVADVEDTEVLLTYLFPASRQGLIHLTATEVHNWYGALESHLDGLLRDTNQHVKMNTQCMLLEIRGHVALFHHFNQGKMDSDGAFFYWNQLAEVAKNAPLFPLEHFANRLIEYARYLGTHSAYEPLTQAVDTLLAERFGNFKVAEKCLDRAKAFRKAGDLPRAMEQLHRAKVDWFAEETLGKSLLALSWLSDGYQSLDLFFAAKYYALAAAYLALRATDPNVKQIAARSLESAASCDYAVGAWHGFLELAEVSLLCHWNFSPEPDADFDAPNSFLQRLIFHLGMLPVVTRLLYPESGPFARERCTHIAQQVGLVDVLEEVLPHAEKTWVNREPLELWRTIEEQAAGLPWSDAGPIRHAVWKTYGVMWHAQWANDYETTCAAEGVLAALQVFLSDLAGEDLCLMRSIFKLSIKLAKDTERLNATGYESFDIQFELSNEESRALITLPPYRHFCDGTLTYDDLRMGILSIASQLLAAASLLPTPRFQEILANRFTQGLLNKLLVGAPYVRCFREFVHRDLFEGSARNRQMVSILAESFAPHFPQALPWRDTPGPGYESENVLEYIENRYRRFARPIERTVKRLASTSEFQAVVAALRADGWKDWHLLCAIFHITMNHRLSQRKIILSPEAEKAAIQRWFSLPEPEDALVVPLSEYTEENLRLQMTIYMSAFAETYGLELHQTTPDFSALEDFLKHRYNFWSDDIDHNDPFACK